MKRGRAFPPLLSACIIFLPAGAACAGEPAIPEGRGAFVYGKGALASQRPVTVYTYRPAGFSADSPILIVMHGMERNGEAYCRSWEIWAQKYRLLLLAPTFTEACYPGSGQYQGGNLFSSARLSLADIPDWRAFAIALVGQAEAADGNPGRHVWALLDSRARDSSRRIAAGRAEAADDRAAVLGALNQAMGRREFVAAESWPRNGLPHDARELLDAARGDLAEAEIRWLARLLLEGAFPRLVREFRNERRPQSAWTYTLVEEIFDRVRDLTGSKQSAYFLYGHSAGGQFVQRMLLMLPRARVRLAIAANPGRYTLPDFRNEWPYGLKGSGCPDANVRRAFSRPLVIMAGSCDTDQEDESLATGAQAMAQGENRLERARYFFAEADREARRRRVQLRWKLHIVEGAAHENARMAKDAARWIGDALGKEATGEP